MSEKIAVIGAGAFGTALAAVIALTERNAVTLVGRDPELIAGLQAEHLHDAVLPGIALPESLAFSAEPDAISDAADSIADLQHRRAERAAHAEVVKALAAFQKSQQ